MQILVFHLGFFCTFLAVPAFLTGTVRHDLDAELGHIANKLDHLGDEERCRIGHVALFELHIVAVPRKAVFRRAILALTHFW